MNYMEMIRKRLEQATEDEMRIVLRFVENVIPKRHKQNKKED